MAKFDIEQKITNDLITMLESGKTAPWDKPWHGRKGENGMPLRANGDEYQGINVLILWMTKEVKGFNSNQWMTFKQAKTLGACVRKGETGSTVCFFKQLVVSDGQDAKGDDVKKAIPMIKAYTVFNLDQIDGLPSKFTVTEDKDEYTPLTGELAFANTFFENTGATLDHGGDRAFYMPSQDRIQMPNFGDFKTVEGYYSTLFHELIHWTKTEDRCDRNFEGSKRFGGKGYATEELVAEIGACFITAKLGIENSVRSDHASYIQSWLKALKNDKKWIFTASAKASQAVRYIETLQVEEVEKVA